MCTHACRYFKLASIHSGLPPLPRADLPEYGAHRTACFPTWHRAYLLEFERMMRRADLALGGDGSIGLPYWDWTQPELNGEVLPRFVRDRLMVEFAADFFPTAPARGAHGYRLSATRTDADIQRLLLASDVAAKANACLLSSTYRMHASTR